MHVRKGDTVLVLAGKDKGKRGKVTQVLPAKGRVVVEGVNKQRRHQKPNPQVMQGGIVTREGPIHASNVMYYCTKCHQPTRTHYKLGPEGSRVRTCKSCGAEVGQ